MIVTKSDKNKHIKDRRTQIPLAILLLIVFFSSNQTIPGARDISKYFSRADEDILAGEYDKAIANYLQGMMYKSWREEAVVFDDLGFAYLQKKEYEDAKKYLTQSIGFQRENFNPRFYLAVVYILNDEIELATEQLKIIEENVYFDQSWMTKTSGITARKPNGKIIKENELERIKKEKGIYLEKKSPSKTIIHLDAFDERNEGTFYFAQGFVYKIKEEFDKAQRKFFEALEAGYNEREVRFQLANLYHKQNKKEEAEEQLKKISSRVVPFPDLHPTKFDVHHRLKYHENYLISALHGKFLKELEKGKINEAIKPLEKSLVVDERSFVINHNLALLYYDIKKIEEAEIYCARALWYKDFQKVSKDDTAGCHDLMGNIFYAQRRFDKALLEFKEALEIDERNAIGHYNLGIAYYALGNKQNAEQEWRKAIEYEKATAKPEKERAISKSELDVSIVVRKKSASFMSHLALSQLYLNQNLIEKAAEECEKAMSLKPSNPQPYLAMAKISIINEEIEIAASYLNKYLSLGGKKDKEVYSLLNLIEKRKKD
ncbi:MAG: tetratricopeptide repeat protein [Candidatus Aminicenantes bacterium]|nr:tetratricopeptide repeat protein [Candidatus Aminicenantes bacterium]